MADNFNTLDRSQIAEWAPADHGLLTWSYDPRACSTSAAGAAGTLYVSRVHLRTAAPVTNVILSIATAGGTLTAGQCFACLYTAAGGLVAVTADQSTAWLSTGDMVMPLAGGPYLLAAGDYYVAYWSQGTTQPAFARGTNLAGTPLNVGLSSPNLREGTANTGLTTTAPPTMGAQTKAGTVGWAALS